MCFWRQNQPFCSCVSGFLLSYSFLEYLPHNMAESDADEIYRVNKLLAIEDMDWSRQLSQAVSCHRILHEFQ